MTKQRKALKPFKAWLVLSAKGVPIQVNHAWGQNFVAARRRDEACEWGNGEYTVRVEIRPSRTSTGGQAK